MVSTATAGILGFNGGAISIDRAAFVNSARGTWPLGLGNDGHDLNLSYTAAAIPEPATDAALLGVVTLALAALRRRRRSA
jgi:MYXO-CTERM domain-containing protein